MIREHSIRSGKARQGRGSPGKSIQTGTTGETDGNHIITPLYQWFKPGRASALITTVPGVQKLLKTH